jgi:hypothetical protein
VRTLLPGSSCVLKWEATVLSLWFYMHTITTMDTCNVKVSKSSLSWVLMKGKHNECLINVEILIFFVNPKLFYYHDSPYCQIYLNFITNYLFIKIQTKISIYKTTRHLCNMDFFVSLFNLDFKTSEFILIKYGIWHIYLSCATSATNVPMQN